jgi:hypothetical protein
MLRSRPGRTARDHACWSTQDERIVLAIPPPPSGTDPVSDLPFLSATNGWGPVERDMSVGGNQAGDGKTITLNGVQYTKGLGTNSVSDVQLYLDVSAARSQPRSASTTKSAGRHRHLQRDRRRHHSLITTPILAGSSLSTTIERTGHRSPGTPTWSSAMAETATATTIATGKNRTLTCS